MIQKFWSMHTIMCASNVLAFCSSTTPSVFLGDDFNPPEGNVSKTRKAEGTGFRIKIMLQFVIMVLKRFSLEMYQYVYMLNT